MAQISLNTRVSPETYARLEKFCREYGKSKAGVVEEALKEYIEKEEAKFKENEK